MDQEMLVLSPEKSILQYRLAGLGSRSFAQIVDLILLFIFMMIMSTAVSAVCSAMDFDRGLTMMLVVGAMTVSPFLYFILQEGLWNGQTFGKKMFGLRVRMADGTPITFGAAVARNLLRVADFLPLAYCAGVLCIATSSRSQRLGDMVAQTVVVYQNRPAPTFFPAPHTVGIHPLENLVGDLRGMTLDEYNALRRLCDRFYELPEGVQNKLLKEVYQPIAIKRKVEQAPNIHPLFLAEAVVMKYGREKGLL